MKKPRLIPGKFEHSHDYTCENQFLCSSGKFNTPKNLILSLIFFFWETFASDNEGLGKMFFVVLKFG